MMHNRLSGTAKRLGFTTLDIDLHEGHLAANRAVAINGDPAMLGHRPLASRINQPAATDAIGLVKEVNFAWGFPHGVRDTVSPWAIAFQAFELDGVRLDSHDDPGRSYQIKIKHRVIAEGRAQIVDGRTGFDVGYQPLEDRLIVIQAPSLLHPTGEMGIVSHYPPAFRSLHYFVFVHSVLSMYFGNTKLRSSEESVSL